MTTTTYPSATYLLDTATTLRRWRIQRAIAVMQRARRDADEEAATLLHRPTVEMPTRQLQRLVTKSRDIAHRPPPHLVGAAVALLLVLAGVILAGGHREGVLKASSSTAVVDGGAVTENMASSTTEWRDDSVVETVSK